MEPPNVDQERTGMDRRDVLRRSAILGGAMVWTVPAVQSIAGAAFAAGTPLCSASASGTFNGVCQKVQFDPTKTCCDCLNANSGAGPFLAVLICGIGGQCQVTGPPTPC
jgi:hypothetical protein